MRNLAAINHWLCAYAEGTCTRHAQHAVRMTLIARSRCGRCVDSCQRLDQVRLEAVFGVELLGAADDRDGPIVRRDRAATWRSIARSSK